MTSDPRPGKIRLVAAATLVMVLAACGQSTGDAQPTSAEATTRPSASATPRPTPTPPSATPSPVPATPEPSETPEPIVVVRHHVPSLATSNADGVAVREQPAADAPLVDGVRQDSTETVPDVRLSAGEIVRVIASAPLLGWW